MKKEIEDALAAYEKLSPEQKEKMWQEQRKSWARGQAALGECEIHRHKRLELLTLMFNRKVLCCHGPPVTRIEATFERAELSLYCESCGLQSAVPLYADITALIKVCGK